MIPVVLRPRVLAIRNRVRRLSAEPRELVRDAVLLLFAASVVWCIYQGTSLMLQRLGERIDLFYLSPAVPLGLLLFLVFTMLVLSNAANAFGALFHARDLDLVLAAPVPPARFFGAKLLEIALTSSWLVVLFGLPAVAAFAVAYGATPAFAAVVLIVLLPYFVIPAAAAVVLVTLVAVVLPPNRTRELLAAAAMLAFTLLYFALRQVLAIAPELDTVDGILRLVTIIITPHIPWMPSYWAATLLGHALEPVPGGAAAHLLLLYSAAVASVALAYLVHRTLHARAYSRARVTASLRRAPTALSARLPVRLPVPRVLRALSSKEYRFFLRDVTQSVQLILLLGICLLYLYNLQIFHAVRGLQDSARAWWEGFLIVSNLCMGAFVISAMCTRFVFPAVSLEGQSMWILLSAPLTAIQMLRAKFWSWFVPVGVVSSLVFAAGALTLDARWPVVLLHVYTAWAVGYGIVGIAVGFGAYFANFDWEHPSQLAASFGSLVFMLVSIVVITINMTAPGFLVFLNAQRGSEGTLSEPQWQLALGTTMVLIAYLNFAVTRSALSFGAAALERRMG